MGNGGEDVGAVRGRAFDTISVVYSALSCLMIDIKILEVVVEINAASTEVAAEEGCMRCKDSGDIDVTLATEGYSETRLPFMKMCNYSSIKLTSNIL